jgi:hypothetical protein
MGWYGVAATLAASQEGLSSIKLVIMGFKVTGCEGITVLSWLRMMSSGWMPVVQVLMDFQAP